MKKGLMIKILGTKNAGEIEKNKAKEKDYEHTVSDELGQKLCYKGKIVL